jgi:hypothetical protein
MRRVAHRDVDRPLAEEERGRRGHPGPARPAAEVGADEDLEQRLQLRPWLAGGGQWEWVATR